MVVDEIQTFKIVTALPFYLDKELFSFLTFRLCIIGDLSSLPPMCSHRGLGV